MLRSNLWDFQRGCGHLSVSEIYIQQRVSGSDDLYSSKITLAHITNYKIPFVDTDQQSARTVNNQQTLEKGQGLNSSITN